MCIVLHTLLQEWLHALAVIQPEEVDRVGQFVFQRDAKFALVGCH